MNSPEHCLPQPAAAEQRAEAAEARCQLLDAERQALSDTLNAERSVAMTALAEYQQREQVTQDRMEQMEVQHLDLNERFK